MLLAHIPRHIPLPAVKLHQPLLRGHQIMRHHHTSKPFRPHPPKYRLLGISRPFPDHRTLVSGAALCGGRAYAMLERFFGMYRTALGIDDGKRYDVLNALAAQGYEEARTDGARLSVLTTFCGTRDNPSALGAVSGIGESLLTPQALAAGVLFGMAEELFGMYEAMPHGHITALAASGNAVRKNPTLQAILSDVFGLPVLISDAEEEAAFGAAMTAARAALAVPASSLGCWVRYREH